MAEMLELLFLPGFPILIAVFHSSLMLLKRKRDVYNTVQFQNSWDDPTPSPNNIRLAQITIFLEELYFGGVFREKIIKLTYNCSFKIKQQICHLVTLSLYSFVYSRTYLRNSFPTCNWVLKEGKSRVF